MRGLFITGTDTGVGKTEVAASIIRACLRSGLRVGAYKPVCTGSTTDASGRFVWGDVERLWHALDGRFPRERICPQAFAAPLAPPSAAAAEKRSVADGLLFQGVEAWRPDADLLVVEGVGGLLCPLTDHGTVADFAAELPFPLVIVAAVRLGAINHTLLTVEVARQRGLPIAGLLLNTMDEDDGTHATGVDEITVRSGADVLGVIGRDSSGRLRLPEVIRRMDWWKLAATDQSSKGHAAGDPPPDSVPA